MIRKCLFPAAGYGTRFLPATKVLPKEMLPVCTKPLIQYGVEEAMEASIYMLAVVTGRGKYTLENHFDISYELEHQIKGTIKEKRLADIRRIIDRCEFIYVRQHEMKGLGHAVLTGESLIGAEPFAVVLADDLCFGEGEGVLSQMKAVFSKKRQSIVAVMDVPQSEISSYGIVLGEEIGDNLVRVNRMIEKPASGSTDSTLAVIGRYILTEDIFAILKHIKPGSGGEIQLTDALNVQAEKGGVLAYRFKGTRYDCGSLHGFVEATNAVYRMLSNAPDNQFSI
ncbi:MAG: UTP--glucose-1-phosphate uridylyltransferase GalU [Helicobacteraceae bacterium]|jgi:UTP--glucose-1-phosphate uridylyltransferase|nr:UTP--glucose-1-phosphate uridylyltransferase GalU [Helicobacteraceae bacterium]